jgi:hypothetical protein
MGIPINLQFETEQSATKAFAMGIAFYEDIWDGTLSCWSYWCDRKNSSKVDVEDDRSGEQAV